jgi:hypothetical protein
MSIGQTVIEYATFREAFQSHPDQINSVSASLILGRSSGCMKSNPHCPMRSSLVYPNLCSVDGAEACSTRPLGSTTVMCSEVFSNRARNRLSLGSTRRWLPFAS